MDKRLFRMPEDRAAAIEHIEVLASERPGTLLKVVLSPPGRSLAQNALLWVYIDAIAEYFLADPMDIHDAICSEFIPRTVWSEIRRDYVRVPGHTSSLNVTEFSELLDKVKHFADENGISLEPPKWLTDMGEGK